jgi:hypothetical protein
MGQYHGRHAARHAAPRARRSARLPRGLWSSKPAAVSMAIVTATATTAMAAESAVDTETVTLTMSPSVVSQSAELSAMHLEDSTRLAGERAGLNAERASARAEIEAAAKEQAEAAALAREQEAARVAREQQRQAEAERKAAALELEAAQENPKLAAQFLMPEYGFGPDQWRCLESLWIGESDWRWWVENPSSGAYGIPQSLPADKMAEEADDWKTNPVTQIKWGLNYIKLSYGTPCGALQFWEAQNPHWY